MHAAGLRGILDEFIKPPTGEKTPINQATSRTIQYTDSNPLDPKMDQSGSSEKGFFHTKSCEEKSTTESEDLSEKRPKMTILRKLCFLLSLNGGVAYVAAFLWFIPCQQPFCLKQQKDWTVNFSGKLTSNMEATLPSSGKLSSIIFGYSDISGGNLASFSISDGRMEWNKRTDHVLRHVFCNFNHLDGDLKEIPRCILTAYGYIAAFDDSNGELSWERNITEPSGEIMHKIALSGSSKNGFYILGVSDAYFFMVSAKNGSQIASVDLPCQWTIDIKLLGPLKSNNWLLVCEFGDSVEVWTFSEADLFRSVLQNINRSDTNPVFKLLFKHGSESASIDLSGDVTRISDSLVLSWADMVAMVTAQAPTRRAAKKWEVQAWGDTGGAPAVTSIISGNFTSSKEIQLAVAIQDGSNATIHILDSINGTSLTKTNLGTRAVMSMEKIAGENDETDVMVIESAQVKSKSDSYSQVEETPTTRSYFTMQYKNRNVFYQSITTRRVFESLLIQHSKGIASLVLACGHANNGKFLERYIILSQQQEKDCQWPEQNTRKTLILD